MVNDIIRKELEGHLHVLVSIKWGFKIYVLDVCTTKFGSWGTNANVPHNFCRDHDSHTCGELIRVINVLAANGDSHLIWVVLLGGWLMTILAYMMV